MNPLVIKVAITVCAGVLSVVAAYWVTRNHISNHQSQHEQVQPPLERDRCNLCLSCNSASDNRIIPLSPCNHKFHKNCASLILQYKVEKTCPVCGEKITSRI